MKILDKLINRIADKVVERINNKNTLVIDGEKLKVGIHELESGEEIISRLIKGRKGKINSNPIKNTSEGMDVKGGYKVEGK